MRINEYLATAVLALTFFTGVYFAEDVRSLRSMYPYTVKPEFFQRPYDLRIVRKEVNGSIESYLADTETRNYQRIGPDLYVGDGIHRLESVIDSTKEFISRHKSLIARLADLMLN